MDADAYDTLGVPSTATPKEIFEAYSRRREDLTREDSALEQAFLTLSADHTRSVYDNRRRGFHGASPSTSKLEAELRQAEIEYTKAHRTLQDLSSQVANLRRHIDTQKHILDEKRDKLDHLNTQYTGDILFKCRRLRDAIAFIERGCNANYLPRWEDMDSSVYERLVMQDDKWRQEERSAVCVKGYFADHVFLHPPLTRLELEREIAAEFAKKEDLVLTRQLLELQAGQAGQAGGGEKRSVEDALKSNIKLVRRGWHDRYMNTRLENMLATKLYQIDELEHELNKLSLYQTYLSKQVRLST